ncbi:hypothetical protein ACH5RR_015234 [Cinchona calisaya]|uniref:GDSL esterase/lipase n=1 Tax=Cinchona calisaya TaxID=153742 RepID=A0ABD2ZVN5_9GENT
MKSPCGFLLTLLICYSFVLFSTTTEAETKTKKLQKPFNNSISSIFIFGDSTVDPGNNNYIHTIFKSNFPPYGKDFLNHIPTGRFSNGRLVTDFIAEYLGIKGTIPPYLDPSLSIEELTTGVSFASGGSGFDPLTAKISSVISIQEQLYLFRQYKARMEQAIGKDKAKTLINKAAYLISCGTNDYTVNYFSTPFRQIRYTISAYQQFLLEILHQFLQDLIKEGAQNIALVGLPPMGCLPIVITLYSDNAIYNRNCIERISSAARSYNKELQNMLSAVRRPNIKLMYADIYNPLNDMIKNSSKYGFSNINIGCCGTGFIEGSVLCNPDTIVCPDDSKYMFWDSVHPTQATYYNLFKALRPFIDSFIRD